MKKQHVLLCRCGSPYKQHPSTRWRGMGRRWRSPPAGRAEVCPRPGAQRNGDPAKCFKTLCWLTSSDGQEKGLKQSSKHDFCVTTVLPKLRFLLSYLSAAYLLGVRYRIFLLRTPVIPSQDLSEADTFITDAFLTSLSLRIPLEKFHWLGRGEGLPRFLVPCLFSLKLRSESGLKSQLESNKSLRKSANTSWLWSIQTLIKAGKKNSILNQK